MSIISKTNPNIKWLILAILAMVTCAISSPAPDKPAPNVSTQPNPS